MDELVCFCSGTVGMHASSRQTVFLFIQTIESVVARDMFFFTCIHDECTVLVMCVDDMGRLTLCG